MQDKSEYDQAAETEEPSDTSDGPVMQACILLSALKFKEAIRTVRFLHHSAALAASHESSCFQLITLPTNAVIEHQSSRPEWLWYAHYNTASS